MTQDEIKEQVQTLFPIKFQDTLIFDEDPADIDRLITRAIMKALSKYEKIEGRELVGSQLFDRAASIVKCVPSATERSRAAISVWDTMPIPQNLMGSVKHYFGPDRYLRIEPNDETVWVEYVVASDKLTVADLDSTGCEWVIEYAVALLKIKEGYIGTSATLTTLPFEFNYQAMLDEGKENKKELEDRLDEMCQGTLSIRVS